MPIYHKFPPQYYSLLDHRPESILLETSRFDESNFRTYLFLEPVDVIEAYTCEDILKSVAIIERHVASGGFAAGYLGYEAGYAFETIAPLRTGNRPLARFGLYHSPFIYDHRLGRFVTQSPDEAGFDSTSLLTETGHRLSHLRLSINQREYREAIERIKFHIREGDTYQINYTTKYLFDFEGSPLSLYQTLQQQQRVAYSALLHSGNQWILSLSPEMFFRIEHGVLTAKPMKGTAPRGKNIQEDKFQSDWLRSDSKNRAENVMIVDLLRNDIGRIAEPGSVKVDDLCSTERYETLFQMTSTITANITPQISLIELLSGLFPSGSVTGAPKIRSMQIIHDLEPEPRGIYTGAIGFFGPDRQAVFNVGIRTIVLSDGIGEMGVGSGIVYDSDADNEFAECQLKATFLTEPGEKFALIETLLWDNGFPLLDLHLQRLKSSAEYFDFYLYLDRVRNALVTENLPAGEKCKIRLLFQSDGTFAIETSPLQRMFSGQSLPLVRVSEIRTDSNDKFLYHKTTRRTLYDSEYQKAVTAGFTDAIFLNERGEVTEGAISNIFIYRNGEMFTPPVSCGLLNGVYRRYLLQTANHIREEVLFLEDIYAAEKVFLCNAVRGIWEVTLTKNAFLQEITDDNKESFHG